MTVENHAAQAACMGCLLNPGWINPYTNWPYYNNWPFPANPNPFQQQTFTTLPFVNTNDLVKLTQEEKDILQRLGEAFNLFTSLDKRSEADNKEFTDAIHRLKQLVALRVARRVDLDVWKQPE